MSTQESLIGVTNLLRRLMGTVKIISGLHQEVEEVERVKDGKSMSFLHPILEWGGALMVVTIDQYPKALIQNPLLGRQRQHRLGPSLGRVLADGSLEILMVCLPLSQS